jgi:diguanylate cyclase (GGDEF)-like protein
MPHATSAFLASATANTATLLRDPAILIVDDAPDHLGVLRHTMAERGYQTLVANCGAQALSVARRMHPDLILMDVVMPGMDGLETCRQLKQNAGTADIPVILMSSRNETDDVVAGFDNGAVDYIAKPLRMAEVCARVRSQLAQHNAQIALQQAALVDPLTRIANRRHFDSFLEHEWQRAVRSGEPLSVMMVDVDHFKQYNDSLGHAAGDAALAQVAKVLAAHAPRPTDLAARYGGEEFAMVFAETPAASATSMAEAIRSRVAALGMAHPRAANGRVTVSVGVATIIPTANDDMASFFKAADMAMYAAKQAGRDRVHSVDVGNRVWESVRALVMP